MSPTDEHASPEATGPIPVMRPVPTPPADDLSAILKNGKLIVVVVLLLTGGSGAGSYVSELVSGGQQAASVQEAIDRSDESDREILAEIRKVSESMVSVKDEQREIRSTQRALSIAIGGDATTGDPGIKGELVKTQRQIRSLKGDVEQIKRRDQARDKLRKIDSQLSDAPLERDEVWDGWTGP